MDLSIACILLLDGSSNGATYALLAPAIVLVFAVTRVILVPQGEFATYGALTLAMLQMGRVPGTVWLLLALALGVSVLDGIDALRHRRSTARTEGMRVNAPWRVFVFLGPSLRLALQQRLRLIRRC